MKIHPERQNNHIEEARHEKTVSLTFAPAVLLNLAACETAAFGEEGAAPAGTEPASAILLAHRSRKEDQRQVFCPHCSENGFCVTLFHA